MSAQLGRGTGAGNRGAQQRHTDPALVPTWHTPLPPSRFVHPLHVQTFIVIMPLMKKALSLSPNFLYGLPKIKCTEVFKQGLPPECTDSAPGPALNADAHLSLLSGLPIPPGGRGVGAWWSPGVSAVPRHLPPGAACGKPGLCHLPQSLLSSLG